VHLNLLLPSLISTATFKFAAFCLYIISESTEVENETFITRNFAQNYFLHIKQAQPFQHLFTLTQ